MKKCDICNEEFNPHEENTCGFCRKEIRKQFISDSRKYATRLRKVESVMRELMKSIEYYNYCEDPKPYDQLDEYDLMMYPIWKSFSKLIGEEKSRVKLRKMLIQNMPLKVE
jgi:hypothetical protein